MQKKLLPITLCLALAGSFFISTAAEASWGASKLPQNPGVNNSGTPPVVSPPGNTETPPQETPQFQSVADQIRYLREQKLNGQGEPTKPTEPNNPGTTNPSPSNPPPTKPEQPSGSDQRVLTGEAAVMVNLLNEERAKNGLKPLTVHSGLTELAKLKSVDMLEKGYFSHTSPTYGSFANMVYNRGISFRSVGENIAQGRNGSHAHILFMASQGHRANILNPNFTHVGISVVQGPYGVYVTQLFIMQ